MGFLLTLCDLARLQPGNGPRRRRTTTLGFALLGAAVLGSGCARPADSAAAAFAAGPRMSSPDASRQLGSSAAAQVGRDGPPALCLNDVRYRTSYATTFTDDRHWRAADGGRWFTTYPWGPSNSGARDAAYYLDRSDGLGRPVYDPFSANRRDGLTIAAAPVSSIAGLAAADVDGYDYASGLISTSGQDSGGKPAVAFSQRYGYYEVKAKLPAGRGIWPAFWLLDATGKRAEIDVFELLGDDPAHIYQSVHYADGRGGSYKYALPFDPTKDAHRFGVLVGPNVDTYYIDGAATKSVPDASINPFYFIVSLQIGGPDSWPGPPDRSTDWPAKLQVLYFRAYEPTLMPCPSAVSAR